MTATRQEQQQTLVEESASAPGVADVIAVYTRVSKYTEARIVNPAPVSAYATGGNY